MGRCGHYRTGTYIYMCVRVFLVLSLCNYHNLTSLGLSWFFTEEHSFLGPHIAHFVKKKIMKEKYLCGYVQKKTAKQNDLAIVFCPSVFCFVFG